MGVCLFVLCLVIVRQSANPVGRRKFHIPDVLAVLAWVQNWDLSLMVFQDFDWEPKNWKFPMADSTSILPHITGLNIHKSPAISFQQKSPSELCTLGETALDQKFAKRLEIKQETATIGSSEIYITLIFI